MKERLPSPPSSVASRIYQATLRLYPAAFRRRYGEEMGQTFEHEWERLSAGRRGARWQFAFRVASDLASTVLREWVMVVPRIALLTLCALALGAVYLSEAPGSFLFRTLLCTCVSATCGVAVVAASGRDRKVQYGIAALGLPLGFVLTQWLSLNVALIPGPETDLLPVNEPSLTAQSIYQRTVETYRQARTYQDEGEVQTVYRGGHSFLEDQPFSTAFVRGGGFRFEFRAQFNRLDRWYQYVIWKDGPSVKTWWTIKPEVAEAKNLASALSVASGGSRTVSLQIPGLLDPDVQPFSPKHSHLQIALMGHQRVAGRDCFKLELTDDDRFPSAKTLWVDAETYLINRISGPWSSTESTRFEETIVYHPQINGPVPATSLGFHPGPQLHEWQLWLGGESGAMIAFTALGCVTGGLNFWHRRARCGRWMKKEAWAISLMSRRWAGHACVTAITSGMWLGAADFNSVMLNGLLGSAALQAGLDLYLIHRRSLGFARLAA